MLKKRKSKINYSFKFRKIKIDLFSRERTSDTNVDRLSSLT